MFATVCAVSIQGMVSFFLRPRCPPRSFASDIFKLNTVNWANGDTQLAAGAMRLDNGVHQLVAADDGVRGAHVDTQGAADAPVFIYPSDAARAFDAVVRIQRSNGLSSYWA